MQIVVLTDDPRLLVRPDKIERRVKGVEERRMIAVANILHIELPVAMNILSGGTQELDRLVEDAVDPGQHALAQIFNDRLDLVAEAAEDQPAIRCDTKLLQTVLLQIERSRHSCHALNAPAERTNLQITQRTLATIMQDDRRHPTSTNPLRHT